MITEEQRKACYAMADGHWTASFIGERGRTAVTDAVIREMESELEERPNQKPRDWIVKNRVKQDPEVRKFLPAILMMLVGFLVQKLLEWLWDRYTSGDMDHGKGQQRDI